MYKLCIFLAKPRYRNPAEILHVDACQPPVAVSIPGHGGANLFIKRTEPLAPEWSNLFRGQLDAAVLSMPGVAAALCLEVERRHFVLVFGTGGRSLLKDRVCEQQFGLLCTLNSVAPQSFRCTDVTFPHAMESEETLGAVVGTPVHRALGHHMSGSDGLCVSVNVHLSQLPALLSEYRRRFEAIPATFFGGEGVTPASRALREAAAGVTIAASSMAPLDYGYAAASAGWAALL